ncbi:hypothetical protein ACLKA6_002741 [Drosophila palustris]
MKADDVMSMEDNDAEMEYINLPSPGIYSNMQALQITQAPMNTNVKRAVVSRIMSTTAIVTLGTATILHPQTVALAAVAMIQKTTTTYSQQLKTHKIMDKLNTNTSMMISPISDNTVI